MDCAMASKEIERERDNDRTRIDWSEISPEKQRALLSMADSWIAGGRVWRAMFLLVTSAGAVAAAIYYTVESFGLIHHSRQ
jgi:hypothetical protein